MIGWLRVTDRKDDPLSNALEIIGVIALALAAVVALFLLVVGIREAPSLVRYVRMRRM